LSVCISILDKPAFASFVIAPALQGKRGYLCNALAGSSWYQNSVKMDATKIIADELNHGRYTENVLKYFFDNPDAYEQELADSEDDLTDDESGIIRLNNIPNLQLSKDEDEEECIRLASDKLDHKISKAISIVTFDGEKDREMGKICNFDCKCFTRRKENSAWETVL